MTSAKRLRRSAAVAGGKGGDDWLLRRLYRPLAAPLARRLMMLRVHPNWITGSSFTLTIGGACIVALGGSAGTVVGVCAIQLGVVLDCCDGTVARWSGKATAVGAILDSVLDRYSDVAILFALYCASASSSTGWLVGALVGSLIGPYVTQVAENRGRECSRLFRRHWRIAVCCCCAMAKAYPVGIAIVCVGANLDTIVGFAKALRTPRSPQAGSDRDYRSISSYSAR